MIQRASRIEDVFLFSNGMVMVFDQDGCQIPEYQGRVEDVKAAIDAQFSGEWKNADWNKFRNGMKAFGV